MKFSGEFNGYIWGINICSFGGDAYVLMKRRADGLKTTSKKQIKGGLDGKETETIYFLRVVLETH